MDEPATSKPASTVPRRSVELRSAPEGATRAKDADLGAIAELINSGELASAISAANDDPDLAV